MTLITPAAPIRLAVRTLFGIEAKEQGDVVVAAGDGAGSLFVDGKAAGSVGQPIRGVTPGRHTLRVVDPDYLEWKGDVFVQPGGNGIRLSLERRPTPWYASWIFWTAVGVAAAAAGGTAIALSSKSSGLAMSEPTYPFGFEVGLPRR